MKTLSNEQARLWCEQRGVSVTERGWLYFDPHDRRSITMGLPKEPHQLVYLTSLFVSRNESTPFKGALLWIREWGVWNRLVEIVGFRITETMRHAHGEAKSVREAPACVFDNPDLVDLQVCLLQPLLVGWDAFMVPENADYIVAVSHDSLVSVIGRTAEVHAKMLALLDGLGPREDNWYFKGYRIPADRP
jgi:hypothetical protein